MAAAVVDVELRPVSPFDLARSARFQGCGTRTFREGVLRLRFTAAGEPAAAAVYQRPDGSLVARIEAADEAAAVDHLRFALGTDDDLRPFLARAAGDALMAPLVRSMRGVRMLRLSTVAHAALRAFAGQLITSAEARRIERRVIAASVPRGVDDLRPPPDGAALGALPPARLEACGLAGRRASALVRLCRTLDLDRLRDHPTDAVVRRLTREPQLGPWSAGVICLQGLGRHDHGLVGDLGLIRLHERLHGVRGATPEDTATMLAPWGEWAGLASVYLTHHPLTERRGPVDGSY